MTPSAAGRRPRLPKGEGRQLRDEILVATEQLLLQTGSAQAVSIRSVSERWGDPTVDLPPLRRQDRPDLRGRRPRFGRSRTTSVRRAAASTIPSSG